MYIVEPSKGRWWETEGPASVTRLVEGAKFCRIPNLLGFLLRPPAKPRVPVDTRALRDPTTSFHRSLFMG